MSFAGTVFDMINRNRQNLAARTNKRYNRLDKLRTSGIWKDKSEKTLSPKKYSKEELLSIQTRVAKKVKSNNIEIVLICFGILLLSLLITLLFTSGV